MYASVFGERCDLQNNNNKTSVCRTREKDPLDVKIDFEIKAFEVCARLK